MRNKRTVKQFQNETDEQITENQELHQEIRHISAIQLASTHAACRHRRLSRPKHRRKL